MNSASNYESIEVDPSPDKPSDVHVAQPNPWLQPGETLKQTPQLSYAPDSWPTETVRTSVCYLKLQSVC